ncbi:MAG: hypothetical protein KGZ93_01345 [Actinobacteria bacterium]|nr:hypothetical protein [Actinomycetota bacterium]
MSLKRKYLTVFLILATFALISFLPQAASAKGKPKVVFVLIDNITWDDIAKANDPFINDLVENNSAALLNNRTYGRPSRPRATVSVGSGVRANALFNSADGYNATEEFDGVEAGDALFVRTGKRAKPGNVVELGLPAIIADNSYIHQDIVPGAMGQLLNDNHLKTAVLGNSDTSYESDRESDNREIVALAMNSSGIVDYGDVSKAVLVKDRKAPYGIRANDTVYLERLQELLKVADFIAIDYGDTTRADLYSTNVLEERAESLKTAALKRAGAFLERAMEVAGDDTVFIIASLSPPGASATAISGDEEQLTTVIISGPGFESGSLTSAATRRAGIINNTDITTTILDILGVTPHYSMVGSEATVGSEKLSIERMNAFNASAVGIKSARRTAVLTFIYLQVALYVVAALLLYYVRKANRRYIGFMKTLILTSMGFPLFTFFASKVQFFAVNGVLLIVAALAVSLSLAAILAALKVNKLFPLAVISCATMFTILADVVLGANLQLNSIFGYDPIRGSRFFGIGNEAFSILLASALLTVGLILERWRRGVALAAGAVVALTVLIVDGFPAFGADVGGIIAITAAFTAMGLHLHEVKLNYKTILLGVVLIGLALFAFVAYDVLDGSGTHMGRTIELIAEGGVSGLVTIVSRKLATNIMVLRYSTWSYFLLIIMVLTVALSYRPVGLLKKLFARHKGLTASVTGAVVGSIVGFAVNDSGILIPAIIMSYIFPSIAYLMLWERYDMSGREL